MSQQLTGPKDWSEELAAIARLAAVPGMSAARLLQIHHRELVAGHFFGAKNAVNRKAAEMLAWPQYADGMPKYRVVPASGHLVFMPSHLNNEMVVPDIVDLITDETDAIIELGCGYGRHLFAIRDHVEHVRPDLEYFGAEASSTGLDAGRQLASLEPGRSRVTFQPFNYLAPDFGFLDRFRNPLFFTCHSIEQVASIGPELFEAMVAIAPQVRCLHHEPVGWQFNADVRNLPKGDPAFRQAKTSLFGAVDDIAAAVMPLAVGWNRDLVPTLTALQEQGVLRIEWVHRHACGNDHYNPTTHIYWTKV
jgi:SAM-dependent methyltransferase